MMLNEGVFISNGRSENDVEEVTGEIKGVETENKSKNTTKKANFPLINALWS